MAMLIRLFPYLLIGLVAAVVLHHFFGRGARADTVHRKMPRQHYRWDDSSLHR
jgi:hypothetical protein